MFHLRGLRVPGGPQSGVLCTQFLLLWSPRTPNQSVLKTKEISRTYSYIYKHNDSSSYKRKCRFISNTLVSVSSNLSDVNTYLKDCGLLTHRLKCDRVFVSRNISTTAVHRLFWEKDPKGGYGSKKKLSHKELIRDGLKQLRSELSLWKEEVREKFEDDPILVRGDSESSTPPAQDLSPKPNPVLTGWSDGKSSVYSQTNTKTSFMQLELDDSLLEYNRVLMGDMDKMWILNTEESLKQWVVTSDQDHGEGFSSASLTLSPTGHGLFSGQISTQVPKDGTVKRAGYCNLKTIRPRKSFQREIYLDWSLYNHLELRLRGDGRSYLINISTAGYFDITWNDIYSYVLYTRGGPHWQVTRIPFSKFFLNSKGRVQDRQAPIPLKRVVSVGISAGDRINAPFRLEIDYLGVYSDPDHTETFAYELYKVPRYTTGH